MKPGLTVDDLWTGVDEFRRITKEVRDLAVVSAMVEIGGVGCS